MIVSALTGMILMLLPIAAAIAFLLLRLLLRKNFSLITFVPLFAGFALSITGMMLQTNLIIVKQGGIDLVSAFGGVTYEAPDGQKISIAMRFGERKCLVVNATGLNMVIDHIYYRSTRTAVRKVIEPEVPPSIEIPAHTHVFLPGPPGYLPGRIPPDEILLPESTDKGTTVTWLHFVDGAPPIY